MKRQLREGLPRAQPGPGRSSRAHIPRCRAPPGRSQEDFPTVCLARSSPPSGTRHEERDRLFAPLDPSRADIAVSAQRGAPLVPRSAVQELGEPGAAPPGPTPPGRVRGRKERPLCTPVRAHTSFPVHLPRRRPGQQLRASALPSPCRPSPACHSQASHKASLRPPTHIPLLRSAAGAELRPACQQ